MRRSLLAMILFATVTLPFAWSQQKPKLTIDDYFNYVEIRGVKLSPDGSALVVGTVRADWAQERFRRDLWLVREGAAPQLLTQSGQDSEASWSPDGRWIAFLSGREIPWTKADESDKKDKEKLTQLYVMSLNGGEPIAVTRGEESVHAFAWSRDSKSLYFATREPWSKARREAYKKEWKDVQRYREADRGDVMARIALSDAIGRAEAMTPYDPNEDAASKDEKARDANKDKETAETPGTVILARIPLQVDELVISHDGRRLAYTTKPPHERLEAYQDYEIFVLDASGGAPRQVTRNQALESGLRWSRDDKQLFFGTATGGVDGKYQRIEGRLYSIEPDSGKAQRWGPKFGANLGSYEIAPDGLVVATAQRGVETQIFTVNSSADDFRKLAGWPGMYSSISLAERSPNIAFVHTAWGKPAEVYVAKSLAELAQARPVTGFNKLFSERDLPEGRAYQWKSDDGASVEGVLIYPPGQFGAKNLPMLTLIHGGPEDADGNSFDANWYDWAALAASRGYLVFRPNYRGSTGYGDKFELEISPKLVSKPGRDILTGVDTLVKDGFADPNRLAIGGYSYGGYMTNWLLTQTTRFKAAVTGAGAVEHVANWGNDDLTFDDAWYLGGTPWEVPKNYNDEAAIFEMNKVKTPTHIVGGSVDIRVYIGEQYLMERALHTLGVPSTLLVFPGEGHNLSVNPWHGKIKVREELKWLDQYCPAGAPKTVTAGQ